MIDVIDNGCLYYNLPNLRPCQAQSCTSRLRPPFIAAENGESTVKKSAEPIFCCAFAILGGNEKLPICRAGSWVWANLEAARVALLI